LLYEECRINAEFFHVVKCVEPIKTMVNEVEEPYNDNSDTELEYAVCQVEVIVGKKCEKTYKVSISTSNCSEHLANIHGITKEQEEADVVSDANRNQNIVKAFSKKTHHQKLRQLELCQYFADWIICGSQPLT
ncbi:16028_t:CDS:2, partial [Funneliformis mosseae]